MDDTTQPKTKKQKAKPKSKPPKKEKQKESDEEEEEKTMDVESEPEEKKKKAKAKPKSKPKETKSKKAKKDQDLEDERSQITSQLELNEEDEAEEIKEFDKLEQPKPILQLNSDGSLPKLPAYAYKMLEKDFGHKSFKKHQAEAVTRIACGLSSLVVLSTGYGKSLIYQFAAKLYAKSYPGSLVLVISPLISLMQDQLHNLSRSIKAAVCDSQMNEKDFQLLKEDLNCGNINILFMSPEAVINKKLRYLPRLAFACIDEVHCLSQWSHNFRPSYLQLSQVIILFF